MARRTAVLAILSTLISSCFLVPQEERRLDPPLIKPQPVDFQEYEVVRHDLVESLEVLAYFQPAVEHRLFFRHSGGRLTRYACELGDQVRAGEVLAELEVDSLKSQIAIQRLMVEKAEIGYERAKVVGTDRYALRSAEIDVELARIRLSDLNRYLAESIIVSPIDGIVVYRSSHTEGEPVEPYSTVVRVADPDRLRLVYSGAQAREFAAGMEVEVSVGEREYVGWVLVTPKDLPSDAPTTERDRVIFSLEEEPAGATRGDLVGVSAVRWRKDQVVAVPSEYLHSYKGKPFVNALVDGVKREIPVKAGLQTATLTEIVEGLQEGDKILR